MAEEPRSRNEYLSGDDPKAHAGYDFGNWKIERLGQYVKRSD